MPLEVVGGGGSLAATVATSTVAPVHSGGSRVKVPGGTRRAGRDAPSLKCFGLLRANTGGCLHWRERTYQVPANQDSGAKYLGQPGTDKSSLCNASQSSCAVLVQHKKYLATYTLFALHATPAYEYTSITLLLVTIFTSLTVITGWQTDHYPLALNAMTW